MTGLIIKDLINLKKQIRIYALIMVVYGFLSYNNGDATFFSGMFTVMFTMIVMTTYSYDTMAKWDGYALTMPISRSEIVMGKYLIMLFFVVIGFILNIGFTLFLNIALKKSEFKSGLVISCIFAVVVILIYCILIPFITKLGIEKARFILMLIYAIPLVLYYTLGNVISSDKFKIPDTVAEFGRFYAKHAFIITLPVMLILLGISYSISVSIYRKKEF